MPLARAVVAIASVCCSACGDCEPPLVPGAFANQPQGAGCGSAAECEPGLACISSICARSCASGCPQGASCVFDACLAQCTSDDTCAAGATSSRCAASAGHDAVCIPRTCFGDAADQMCPAGFRCVGRWRWTGSESGAGGVGGPYCPTTGWCQRVP